MEESHKPLHIHRPEVDAEARKPASPLSQKLQAAIEEKISSNKLEARLQVVDALAADYAERLNLDPDDIEAATSLGELGQYRDDLQKRRIDKAA